LSSVVTSIAGLPPKVTASVCVEPPDVTTAANGPPPPVGWSNALSNAPTSAAPA
jgi:hypothetical protein